MCNFISWIEFAGEVLFLKDSDLELWNKSKDKPKIPDKSERCGHGAIRLYYGLKENDGIQKECTDFSKPSNFPNEIIKAIKSGLMTYATPNNTNELLTATADKAYQEATATAYWELFSKNKNRVACWKGGAKLS